MSVAFKPGQTLTQDDLKISVRNSTGQYVDPFYIRYSLFDNTTGTEVLIGPPDRIPATIGVGIYYVDATLPLDSNIGDWVVRWNFRENVSSPLVEVCQEFAVVKENVTLCTTSNTNEQVLLNRLRIQLRDNAPDRNYSVSGEESVCVKVNGVIKCLMMKELWEIIGNEKNSNL